MNTFRLHSLVDGAQISFRQHQAQGAGGRADLGLPRFPILRLRRILVAGHYAPLAHIAALGEQDIPPAKNQIHKLSALRSAAPLREKLHLTNYKLKITPPAGKA